MASRRKPRPPKRGPTGARRRVAEHAAALELEAAGVRQSVEFTLDGPPQPKGRPRFGGGTARTPDATRRYEAAIRNAAHMALLTEPRWPKEAPAYELTVVAHFANWRSRDIDNVIKAVADGLEGVAYDSDRRVMDVRGARRVDSEWPRTVVRVSWRVDVAAVMAARDVG